MDSPILNKLAQANDGRSHALGEATGTGYLGGLGERPVVSRSAPHEGRERRPDRDTKNCYAFKTGPSAYILVSKSRVDKDTQ